MMVRKKSLDIYQNIPNCMNGIFLIIIIVHAICIMTIKIFPLERIYLEIPFCLH